MHLSTVHSLCIVLLTTLQVSSMLQGSGVTDACDAGCAQHCPMNPAREAVFTSPLCKCGEVNLLYTIHAGYRVWHRHNYSDCSGHAVSH